jgi:hydrogenase nickel incorporation protein HypA/HybF
MHELSIAHSIVEIVTQHAEANGPGRVTQVDVQIGALTCVHPDALRFSFALLTADTPLAGAELRITQVPVMVYCGTCHRIEELDGIQDFRCPVCQVPSCDVRQGQELDVVSIELSN